MQRGDFVKVKKGIKDPDFKRYLMTGWQGVITEVEKDGLLMIKWDAQTLLDTPFEYLEKIVTGGYDHELMRLNVGDLEKVNTPDKSRDAEELGDKVDLWVCLINLFEKRARKYIKIFEELGTESEYELPGKWEEYLDEALDFPFETKVDEYQRSEIQEGDIIKVRKIVEADEHYGLLISGKHEGASIIFPLCDLEVTDKKNKNYELVDDYRTWFANR